mgnify:CR=1 FL=1
MRKNYYNYCLLFIACCLLAVALPCCEVINPDEGIPSYIQIDTIQLSTDYTAEGTESHKITDAWVYVNDQLIGTYELPATVPVLKSGSNKIVVYAGIKMNGVSATRIPYPFYEPYEITTELFPDSIIKFEPVVHYYSSATFPWKEDFENPGYTLEITSMSDTTFDKVTGTADVFEGSSSGHFVMRNPPHILLECKTINEYALPKGGKPVFLELNYKCNNTFRIGIFENEGGASNQVPQTIVINKSENWNKIYVNLTNEINLFANATSYNVYFGVIPDDESNPQPEVFIDNIKLVY